jgi:hypothetical protein
MNITIIVMIFVVVLFLVMISRIGYNTFVKPNYTSLLCSPTDFKGNFNAYISNTKLPLSESGSKYSYTLSIYIPNVAENSEWYENVNFNKTILNRFGSPNILYNPKHHHFIVQVAYKDNLDMVNHLNITTSDLPMQKWVFIGIVVDNRNVDLYIDDELISTSKLPNVPFIYNRNIYLGEQANNFNGSLKNIRYYNTALNQDQIKSVYNSTC